MDGGPWWATVHGVAKSRTTEWLHFHFSLLCIGEGNGNPLQCSCLENPRDWGAWWAAVYGVAQSRTRLKRLSSSRSLLNLSCIFSILVSRLSVTTICFQGFGSFSLSTFRILYQVDSVSLPLLFGLVGIYHVPLPDEYFSAFSPCLDCSVWGCLSVFWQFLVPLYCGGSSLWVGLGGWLVKISFLGKLLSVFWWVELDFFCLEYNEMPSSEFWDVYGFGVTLGSLCIELQGYVPALLGN